MNGVPEILDILLDELVEIDYTRTVASSSRRAEEVRAIILNKKKEIRKLFHQELVGLRERIYNLTVENESLKSVQEEEQLDPISAKKQFAMQLAATILAGKSDIRSHNINKFFNSTYKNILEQL